MHNQGKMNFSQINPSKGLEDFVDSYWTYKNPTDKPKKMTIFPDSFFKLIVEFQEDRITRYFLTGLWTKEVEIISPPNSSMYGIKFKILAPEYIFQKEIASFILSHQDLQLNFWDINDAIQYDFRQFIDIIELKLIKGLKNKTIPEKKYKLSQLLYSMHGDISVEDISDQINWSNRQINRYLNKYLGVSLKTYLNIQKCHSSYSHIGKGKLHPINNYFDQSQFIREIKKHIGKTPKEIYKNQNDRFIQLKLNKRK